MTRASASSPAEYSTNAAQHAFAELVVGVGVNIQPEQELIIAAPIEAASFVRSLASASYKRGASLVTPIYDDPELLRRRLLDAETDELERTADWLANSVAKKLCEGAAHLSVLGPRPELLAGVEISRILRAHKAQARAHATVSAIIANMETNASAVPFVTGTWARQIFPESEPDAAQQLLWSALFDAVGGGSTTTSEEAARRRLRVLSERRARLQALGLRALQCRGPGVRVTIGLAEGHIWRGGEEISSRGITFVPSLPAEALFTATDPDKTEGRIAFSRSIAVAGEQVDGLEVFFDAGIATRVTAKRGQHEFEQLLDSDPGARRLGKVALVEATAPLARQLICFQNPMLDGAAAPHIAFGAGLPTTLRDPSGANASAIHLDAMFGPSGLSVDGIDADGTTHAVLRDGLFVL